MKSIKKIFAGLLLAATAFGFFGCAATEEDDALLVDFTVSGTTEKTVKMDASSPDSNGHRVFVIYTLDGSEPKADMILSYDKAQFVADVAAAEKATATASDKQKILSYIDCGTAEVIGSGESIKVSATTTITAKAFYIVAADIRPLKTGPVEKETITIAAKTDDITDASAPQTGDLTFKLSSTGNSLSTHYFDTVENPFKYTYDKTGYDHCYYQIQFSWKGSGKGNWYLYVRQIGKAAPIGNKTEGTNFLAKGVYEGNCFDASNGSVANGALVLKTLKGNSFGSVTVSGSPDAPQFSLAIDSDTANATGNVSQAIFDAK